MTSHAKEQKIIERFLLLSIAAAILTIALKSAAAYLTGSVGFLSDALESVVNLVAAIVALIATRIAAKPADANHNFGHGKSEYVSALVEGAMIFVAAAMIIYTAIGRLLDPAPLEQVGIGLFLSIAATLINLGVGLALLKAGKQYRSSALNADGQHLLTDVWIPSVSSPASPRLRLPAGSGSTLLLLCWLASTSCGPATNSYNSH